MTSAGDLDDGFQRDVLRAVIALEQTNEHVIGPNVDDYLSENGYDQVTASRLYPSLDSLVAEGLLEKQANVPSRRSNAYSATPDGYGFVRQFLVRSLTEIGVNADLAETVVFEECSEAQTTEFLSQDETSTCETGSETQTDLSTDIADD